MTNATGKKLLGCPQAEGNNRLSAANFRFGICFQKKGEMTDTHRTISRISFSYFFNLFREDMPGFFQVFNGIQFFLNERAIST